MNTAICMTSSIGSRIFPEKCTHNGNTANTEQVNAKEAVAAGLLMDEMSCEILTSMQADNRSAYLRACKPHC